MNTVLKEIKSHFNSDLFFLSMVIAFFLFKLINDPSLEWQITSWVFMGSSLLSLSFNMYFLIQSRKINESHKMIALRRQWLAWSRYYYYIPFGFGLAIIPIFRLLGKSSTISFTAALILLCACFVLEIIFLCFVIPKKLLRLKDQSP